MSWTTVKTKYIKKGKKNTTQMWKNKIIIRVALKSNSVSYLAFENFSQFLERFWLNNKTD